MYRSLINRPLQSSDKRYGVVHTRKNRCVKWAHNFNQTP